jgi:three-Cys-motif partner protein
MGGDHQADTTGGGDLQHLKRVSRIKHIILQNYLPPWATILGSRHRQLAYFDCFAGPGEYELEGKPVAGSPVIAVKGAIQVLQNRSGQSQAMYLIEDDPRQVERLVASLRHLQPYPKNLTVNVYCADSRSYIPDLLEGLGMRRRSRSVSAESKAILMSRGSICA